MNRYLGFVVIAASLVSAGCSQASQSSPPTSSGVAEPIRKTHRLATQTLYIGNESGVAAYDLGASTLERTYGRPTVSYVSALAQDASGNLYVADSYSNEVLKFAAGSTQLLQTVTHGVSGPSSIAFDGEGNLYVANDGQTKDVTVYSPDGRLIRTITQGIDYPGHVALDSRGNLYVANYAGPVTEYDLGLKKVTRTINAANQAGFIMLDAHDDLYVSICGKRCMRPSVIEFAPQSKRVLRKITDGIRDSQGLALDSAGNLFVADANYGGKHRTCYVTAYAPNRTSAYETISSGVHDALDVAIDAADNLYVANYKGLCNGSPDGSVTVYPAGGTTYTHKLTESIIRPSLLMVGT